MDRHTKAGKPFFYYFNSTRMHLFTHLKPESEGKTGPGVTADGMVEHDDSIGALLKNQDDFGITENTIVVYTSNNGAEIFTYPDDGTTYFKGEKATNWEGSFPVPALFRHNDPRHVRPRRPPAHLRRRCRGAGCLGKVPHRLPGER